MFFLLQITKVLSVLKQSNFSMGNAFFGWLKECMDNMYSEGYHFLQS